MKTKTSFLLTTALIVAWCFDQFFFKHTPGGISFLVYVCLCLLAGAVLSWRNGFRPARTSLLLLPPLLFFAAVTAIRMEPFTRFIAYLLTLAGLMLLTVTWRGGYWLRYSLSDYVLSFLRLASSALLRPLELLPRPLGNGAPAEAAAASMDAITPVEAPSAGTAALAGTKIPVGPTASASVRRLPGWGLLHGLALALPVVAVLAALLASADPVFANDLERLLQVFRIENLGEYVFRGLYILVGAYLLCGIFLHLLGPSAEEKLTGLVDPWLAPFLGWVEAAVVLASVDLLFLAFVIVQFRYFFGGRSNIHVLGFTYADFARRGFNELVWVALLSLLLLLSLATVTRRLGRERRLFTGLSIGLVALVQIILVSAFQRLLLYEAAYGYTRIRVYTHIFMIWLGILLLVLLLLEVLGKLRTMGLVMLVTVIGFGVTLALVNVDGLIVAQNIARAQAGYALDGEYLQTLSADSVPALVAAFKRTDLTPATHRVLLQTLQYRHKQLVLRPDVTTWQEYHFSTDREARLLDDLAPSLTASSDAELRAGLRHIWMYIRSWSQMR